MWTTQRLIEAMAKELERAADFASGKGTNQAGTWNTLAKEALAFIKEADKGPKLTDEEWCQIKDALREHASGPMSDSDPEGADALTRIVCKIMEQQRAAAQ